MAFAFYDKVSGLLHPYPSIKQLIKFCLVGASSAVINFSCLYVLTERFAVWYVISAGIGFVVSACFNFSANKLWTFRNTERGSQLFRQAAKFLLVVGFGLALNTVLMISLTEFVGFDYRLSWLFATAVVTVWNYVLNRLWTFQRQPAADLSNSDHSVIL